MNYLESLEYEAYQEDPEWESDLANWESEVNRRSPAYIRWVQQALNKIMGLRLTVDGVMGPATRSAIRSFQQKHGLTADGIVGIKTEAAIKAATMPGAPVKMTPFRYVKDFSGPAAECVAALRRAGKTKAEALTIINTQIGVAIGMLRKAATDLKRGSRSSRTRGLFLKIFRVRPEFVPTWLKTTATIKDRGDVVATRCKRVADLLASGRIKFFCTINSTNCPDCSNDPSDFACSSWGDESVAPRKSNVICLGNAFWDDMKAGKTSSLLATLMHEPFHIYYGKYVTEHRSDAGKFGGINCIVQFVFERNGRVAPDRVNQRCKDMAVRNELGEGVEEVNLEMEVPGVQGVSGSACVKTYTVQGFGYTRSSLTSSQKALIATIAAEIFSGRGAVPPLARVKEITIVGFSSGTRRLHLYASRRATSVFEELTKRLRGLGATAGDIAKINFGDPVTKPVKSQAASDPHFRKVMICIVRPTSPRPKPLQPDLTDYPAFLQSKLRDSLEFLEEKVIDPNETMICLIKKLMDHRTNDLWIDPSDITDWFKPANQERGVPVRHLRKDLIEDLKKGYGRGPIKKFVSRFEVVHLQNILNALGEINRNCKWEPTGRPPTCRKAISVLSRLAKDRSSLYNCKALRQIILGK